MLFTTFVLFTLSTTALSHPHDNHAHTTPRALPGNWFQRRDHPVHSLFTRQDGQSLPEIGTPEWRNAYPDVPLDANAIPQEWKDALQRATDAGKIPNLPQSTTTPQTNPTYPDGFDPNGPEICSATYKCRNPDDIWDAPDGFFGTGFDDGPQPISDTLVKFLQDNNELATHFLIGLNIRDYPDQFKTIINGGGDLAVHTYSHPYMTTLSNLEVVAQLGWTMKMIHDSTGLVPKFWRPPFGDSDNRVRAIALEVFGLEKIMWNQDTIDWSLTTGGTTPQTINASMTEWLTGPKSPGLIVLEHELSEGSVQAFMDAYPVIKANGWTMASVASFADGPSAYQNRDSSSGTPKTQDIVLLAGDDNDKDNTSTTESTAPSSASVSKSSAPSSASATVSRSSAASASASAASSNSGAENGAPSLSQMSLYAFTLGSVFVASLATFVHI